MLAAYIVCAIVAGGLILVAALGGLSDHVAMHHEGGPGADHHAELSDGWLQLFTLRFWTYAIGGFGLAGTLLTWLNPRTPMLTLGAAIGTGLASGLMASLIVRALRKSEGVSSSIGEDDFVGAVGKVSVAIRDGVPGKVRTTVKGDTIDYVAFADPGESIDAGEEVVLLTTDGDRVHVARASTVFGEDDANP